MALRETQHVTEAYTTGGETFRETQHMAEVYSTGGETFRLTQHVVEVYATVALGRPRFSVVGVIG